MDETYTIGRYNDHGYPDFIVGFKIRGTVQAYLAIDGDYYVTSDFRQSYRSSWEDVHRHLFHAKKMMKEDPARFDIEFGIAEIFEVKYVALAEVAPDHARDKAVATVRNKLEKWELDALREHLKNGGEL
jgi:hypothetical protein